MTSASIAPSASPFNERARPHLTCTARRNQQAVAVGQVFSPDGTRLVFSSYHREINGGREDLWTINVDGSGHTRLTSPLDGFGPGEDDPVWGTAP